MKKLIQKNGWKMTTPFESKLGEPVLKSIEKDVSNSSHVVYLITKEDGENENVNHTMTIEMAFQSLTDKGLGGRVIPVFCCDISFVSPKLRSLTGANIHDEALEGRLSRSIDVNIRKKREEEYRSVSEPSQGASSSRQPQQTSHGGTEGTQEIDSGRQEDLDEKLTTVARKVFKHEDLDHLGKALGFEPEDIERYVSTNMKNAHISYMGTLSMLRDWRDRQTEATECEALKDVLKKAGQIRLADILFEPLQGASSSQPQQPSHQSKEEILENVSGRQEDFDENLITIARKIVKHEEIYKLGKGLGFEPADIERYVNTNMKNAHISYMGTLSMLRDWRDTQTKATECKALKDVLRKVGQIRLADELFCTS
ncbi:uncharacterized protein LOC115918441 [Strongylocentrotus purpuratus]|uniref:Death domain-containing protein n=1 Tax=Strongylocentrotus purpuratus TaxID=7668 RepID=A0A7M7NC97_STRPU|nr:uncharacterized protein LOC115918441 [Strongylocentrotus purpuratus]